MAMLRVSGFLLVLAAIAHTGLSLECFHCNSDDNVHCTASVNQTGLLGSTDCAELHTRLLTNPQAGAQAGAGAGANFPGTPKAGPNQPKPVCYTAVLSEKQHSGGHQDSGHSGYIVSRGCGLLGKKDQCQYIKEEAANNNLEIKSCKVCEEGLCNSAPQISLSLLFIVPSVIAALYRAA